MADLIDTALRWLAARWHRRRLAERDALRAEWERMCPGRCLYCSYTRWANEEHGQNLKLEPHACVEGRSPVDPAAVPRARVVRR